MLSPLDKTCKFSDKNSIKNGIILKKHTMK